MGGTARVGQVQLLQIFFTIAFSALFFGESVQPSTWLFAAAVIATVLVGRKAAVRTAAPRARAGLRLER
jgi:drug/metabolite transporter (DMT)-like permease